MGVDVYLVKPHKPEIQAFIGICEEMARNNKELEHIGEAMEMYLDFEGTHEWLMQFSLCYTQWLYWMVANSGGDLDEIDGHIKNNTRFTRLIEEGHPWDKEDRFILTTEECKILLSEITWFINTRMDAIPFNGHLKDKTIWFKASLEKVVAEGAKMIIG